MAANIFGERFLGRDHPAWHDIGNVFHGPKTASQAAKEAGLLYNVRSVPVTGNVETPFGLLPVEYPNRFIIMRDPTPDDDQYRPFGLVGGDYQFIQNEELAVRLDPIAERWPIETAGALGDGETVFLTFSVGELEIAEEQYKGFFVFTDTKDGKHKAKMMFTPVRVVCQNTLVMAERQAAVSVDLTHNASFDNMVDWQLKLVSRMQTAQALSTEALTKLSRYALAATQVDDILEKTYPAPKRPAKSVLLDELESEDMDDEVIAALYNDASRANKVWEYYVERATKFRDGAKELFVKFNDEQPKLAGTAYALFQSVVECADYRNGDDETIPASTLWGVRAKEKVRCWNALMKEAKED